MSKGGTATAETRTRRKRAANAIVVEELKLIGLVPPNAPEGTGPVKTPAFIPLDITETFKSEAEAKAFLAGRTDFIGRTFRIVSGRTTVVVLEQTVTLKESSIPTL